MASALLSATLAALTAAGQARVVLFVHRGNPAAPALYGQSGIRVNLSRSAGHPMIIEAT